MATIRVITVAALTMLGALLTSAAALAVDVSLYGHDTQGSQAQGEAAGGVVESGGTLPFTGLNLFLIVIAGAALLATGLMLRRRSGSARR